MDASRASLAAVSTVCAKLRSLSPASVAGTKGLYARLRNGDHLIIGLEQP